MDPRLVLSDDLYAYLTLTLIYVNHICIMPTVKLCHIWKGHCFLEKSRTVAHTHKLCLLAREVRLQNLEWLPVFVFFFLKLFLQEENWNFNISCLDLHEIHSRGMLHTNNTNDFIDWTFSSDAQNILLCSRAAYRAAVFINHTACTNYNNLCTLRLPGGKWLWNPSTKSLIIALAVNNLMFNGC